MLEIRAHISYGSREYLSTVANMSSEKWRENPNRESHILDIFHDNVLQATDRKLLWDIAHTHTHVLIAPILKMRWHFVCGTCTLYSHVIPFLLWPHLNFLPRTHRSTYFIYAKT